MPELPLDVVVDTNVWCHASNPAEATQKDAWAIVCHIHKHSTVWLCVDVDNLLWTEYQKHVTAANKCYPILIDLLTKKRVRWVSRKVGKKENSIIKQMVRNKNDRNFIKVTLNSAQRILVSHDFEDFQQPKRCDLKKQLSVLIITASEYLTIHKPELR